MTEANLVTIDTNNYESMAKAMGIANETSSSTEKKTQQLPRFRIQHTPIIEGDEILVKGGTYKLDIPEGNILYGKTATIRPFMQRYMYKRFVKNMSAKAGEPLGVYHKTVMADNLNKDLKDNQGGFNCGKPAGWIQDFDALPDKTKDLIKQIKRVRVIFGLVDLHDATDAQGKEIAFETTPFIWEIDNRDAFKTIGSNFTKLAKMKALPVQHTISLATEARKLPNGSQFYLPTSTLNLSEKISLSDTDQTMFADFLSWIENYNQYIVSEWNEQASQKSVDEDMSKAVDSIVSAEDNFIEVENA
tara:strand:+ start:585 stop:1493 length:909 start_codon:yes stop_codon:yes gene_type:complete